MNTFSQMCLFAVELICQALQILIINLSICITSEVKYECVFRISVTLQYQIQWS